MDELARVERIRTNKALLTCYTVLGVVLLLAYTLEVFKGHRTPIYTIVVMAIGWAPLIYGWLLYKKQKDMKLIQILAPVGYSLFYVIILLTGKSTSFVYIMPMLFIMVLTCNLKLLYILNGALIISNIISVVINIMTTADREAAIVDAEVQVACMILCSVFSIVAIRVITSNNNHKAEVLLEKEERANELLDRTTQIVTVANDKLTATVEATDRVNENIANVLSAMEDVSAGADSTAETAEEQLLAVRKLDETIHEVKENVDAVDASMQKLESSIDSCTAGSDAVDTGIREIGEQAASILERAESLSAMAGELNGIVDIISKISSQTKLLSLNASIESARAGEAGRGFAVVAGEIGSLVEQTEAATRQIGERVGNIQNEIASVRKDVEGIERNVIDQQAKTKAIVENLAGMQTIAKDTQSKMKVQLEGMNNITTASNQISDGITTLSGVSEETTAGARQTLELVNDSASQMENLAGDIKELQAVISN